MLCGLLWRADPLEMSEQSARVVLRSTLQSAVMMRAAFFSYQLTVLLLIGAHFDDVDFQSSWRAGLATWRCCLGVTI